MKILIADDHELFLKGLEFILNENFQHPEITTAQSYTDIFSILEQKQDFDLIITDLAMPGAAWLPALNQDFTLWFRIRLLRSSLPFLIKKFSNRRLISALLDISPKQRQTT